MIQNKLTRTLLFAVLLMGWVYFASSQPPSSQRDLYSFFRYRLEQVIDASAPDVLPFALKARVIQDWLLTSNEFKDLCLLCETELRNHDGYTPVMALTEAINRTFNHYIYGANTNFLVLGSIKSGDPIGFNAYLTQNDVTISSPDFMQHAVQFQATMKQRVRLLNMKTNDLCFEIFEGSSSSTPRNFPPFVRADFATEYGPISDKSMDSVLDFLSEKMIAKMPTGMYHIGTTVDNYQVHFSPESDDVQIIYGGSLPQEDNQATAHEPMHPICVRYMAIHRRVFVYGKVARVKLDDRQQAIIKKLYPFKKDIVTDTVPAFKKIHPFGGIFAIMYATILALRKNPVKVPLKINEVWGDETLYMRIHILNMLANRKVFLTN